MKKFILILLLCCLLVGCTINEPLLFSEDDLAIETSSVQVAHRFYADKIEKLFDADAYGCYYFDQYDILHIWVVKGHTQQKDLERYIEEANAQLYSISISPIEYGYDAYSYENLKESSEHLESALKCFGIPYRSIRISERENRIVLTAQDPNFWYQLVIRQFVDLNMIRFKTPHFEPM